MNIFNEVRVEFTPKQIRYKILTYLQTIWINSEDNKKKVKKSSSVYWNQREHILFFRINSEVNSNFVRQQGFAILKFNKNW